MVNSLILPGRINNGCYINDCWLSLPTELTQLHMCPSPQIWVSGWPGKWLRTNLRCREGPQSKFQISQRVRFSSGTIPTMSPPNLLKISLGFSSQQEINRFCVSFQCRCCLTGKLYIISSPWSEWSMPYSFSISLRWSPYWIFWIGNTCIYYKR